MAVRLPVQLDTGAVNAPAAFIEGDGVCLRPQRRSDIEGPMQDWLADREVVRHLVRGTYPWTVEAQLRAYDARTTDTGEAEFTIVEKNSDRPIGVAGLHGIHAIARHAEFRVLIGARQAWNRGYGTAVCELLCAYAFELLNLNKVWLGVNADNRGALRSYVKAGFAEEGRLRQEVYRNGRYHDVVRMSLLRAEYERKVEQWRSFPWISRQLRDLD
jgi:[ribosomal protein S5]-alanine N-acetyltransferase